MLEEYCAVSSDVLNAPLAAALQRSVKRSLPTQIDIDDRLEIPFEKSDLVSKRHETVVEQRLHRRSRVEKGDERDASLSPDDTKTHHRNCLKSSRAGGSL